MLQTFSDYRELPWLKPVPPSFRARRQARNAIPSLDAEGDFGDIA